MGHIFISYSHQDKSYVHQLQDALQREGFEVWVDDRIDYGTEWPKVIQKHLDECDAFIVVLTDNAYESKWVQNEVARAARKKKTIFPLLLQGDGWLSVEATQYVDVTNRSLPTERFYKRLAQAALRTKQETSASKPPKFTLDSKVVFWIVGGFAVVIFLSFLSVPALSGLIQTSTPTPTIAISTNPIATSTPTKTITPTASITPTQTEISITPTQTINLLINDLPIQKPGYVISDKNASLMTLLGKWNIGKLAKISPSGNILAVGEKNVVTLFDIYSNKTISRISSQVGNISTMAFSQDGTLIAIGTGSGYIGENTEVIVWDIQAAKILRSFKMNKVTKVNSVALSPDNKRVAIGLWIGIAKVFDINSGNNFFWTGNQYNTFTVAYSPGGTVLASGGGNRLIERPQETLILYDMVNRKRIRTLDANHGAVYSMDFTSDGKTLAMGLQDGAIALWDTSGIDYKKLFEFNTSSTSEISSVAFSPDGQILASSSSNEIKIWNSGDGLLLKFITLNSKIETLTFSPDGTFIVCSTNDGVIQLWGVQE